MVTGVGTAREISRAGPLERRDATHRAARDDRHRWMNHL
jgi:hypothetical protein